MRAASICSSLSPRARRASKRIVANKGDQTLLQESMGPPQIFIRNLFDAIGPDAGVAAISQSNRRPTLFSYSRRRTGADPRRRVNSVGN